MAIFLALFLAQIPDVGKLIEKPAIPNDTAFGQFLNLILWVTGVICGFVFLYYAYIKPKNDERLEKQKFEYDKFKLEKQKEIQDQIDLRFKVEQENKDIRAKYYAEGYNNMVKVLDENRQAVRDMANQAKECKEVNCNTVEVISENNERLTASLNNMTKELAVIVSKMGGNVNAFDSK